MAEITMRQLLKVGVHFGHQSRYWSPKMAPYIFGTRNKIHIINLEKTLPMLRQAMEYISRVAAGRGKVLFVGTKRQASDLVREYALRCDSPYVDHRWLGGMLTNYNTVKNSIARLKSLEEQVEPGQTVKLRKKEALRIERERYKLNHTLSGIKDMGGLPDVLFVIDVEQEYIAVSEANKLGIPVVAIVDTNCSPDGIDYIIPANDDSTAAIRLYLEAASDSVIDGRSKAETADAAQAESHARKNIPSSKLTDSPSKVSEESKKDAVTDRIIANKTKVQNLKAKAVSGVEVKPATAGAAVPEVEVKPAIAGAEVPEAEVKPATAGAEVPEAEVKPATAGAAVPEAEVKPATAGAAVPEAEVKPATAGAAVPEVETKPAVGEETTSGVELKTVRKKSISKKLISKKVTKKKLTIPKKPL